MCAFKLRYTHRSSPNVGRHSQPRHCAETMYRLPASSDLVCETMALGYMNQDPGNKNAKFFSELTSKIPRCKPCGAKPAGGSIISPQIFEGPNLAEPVPSRCTLFELKNPEIQTRNVQ
ncbi:hypothetical protein EDD85DRAFT_797382 [Armillaria nabsnona]|nr:hypothetical protein EDD85DRAFT_797382 [Armillaria nabsnona]